MPNQPPGSARTGLPRLEHTVVTIVGRPFLAVWSPEDSTVRAAGFAAAPDAGPGELLARLARRDPASAARDIAKRPVATGAIPEALRAYDADPAGALEHLSVVQPGTPFRGSVWRALQRVPPGRTVSYTELAALAGRPSAVRAAASACATNLIALFVPCHRSVRADASLGGYLFGVDVKERLLLHEARSDTRGAD